MFSLHNSKLGSLQVKEGFQLCAGAIGRRGDGLELNRMEDKRPPATDLTFSDDARG